MKYIFDKKLWIEWKLREKTKVSVCSNTNLKLWSITFLNNSYNIAKNISVQIGHSPNLSYISGWTNYKFGKIYRVTQGHLSYSTFMEFLYYSSSLPYERAYEKLTFHFFLHLYFTNFNFRAKFCKKKSKKSKEPNYICKNLAQL